MFDTSITPQTIEEFKKEIKYLVTSLNINNFEPITRQKLKILINNSNEILKFIKYYPSVKQQQSNMFPIGSVCSTYSNSATIIKPQYPGTWVQCGSVTGSPTGNITFWHRTA